eukprot:3625468-Ditylum_brightwellii.AAC.1
MSHIIVFFGEGITWIEFALNMEYFEVTKLVLFKDKILSHVENTHTLGGGFFTPIHTCSIVIIDWFRIIYIIKEEIFKDIMEIKSFLTAFTCCNYICL